MSQLNWLEAAPPTPADVLQLRQYQQEAREAVRTQHELHRATLVVLPTGAGKSRLAAALCHDYAPGSTLLLGPSIVLCDQLHNEMRRSGLSSGIERADQVVGRLFMPTCVVGSVATLKGTRLRSWPRNSFAHVIVDEAHRSTSEMYTEILAHFASAKVTGLTATPDRADGVGLGNVFGSVAYEMTLMDAIERGILCRLEIRTIATDFDPKRLKELAGEVEPSSVAKELVRSGALHQAAGALAELAESERCIAFLPTVNAAKAFAVELNARGVTSAHVDASTPPSQRDALYRAFREGKIRVVTNCNILGEGFDDPGVSCIALLSPTKSRSRLAQYIGRSTRNAPGKTRGLVLDFIQGRMKRGRLAGPLDALAGKMLPDNVMTEAGDGDMVEQLRGAEERAAHKEAMREAREAAAQADRERRAALMAARGLVQKQRITYATSSHDAADLLGRAAAAIGIDPSRAMDEDERRKRMGICSIKQARIAVRYGLSPDMSRANAGIMMEALIAGHWKLPDAVRARLAK